MSAIRFSLDQSEVLSFGKVSKPYSTLYQARPGFSVSPATGLLKTLWEEEKLCVTSNFSFFHSAFNQFGKLSAIFIKFEIVICKLPQFGGI